MIRPLQDIIIEKIAKLIDNDNFNILVRPLDRTASDKMFSELMKLKFGLCEETLTRFGHLFRLKKVDLFNYHLKEDFFEAIRSQNLESLSLGDLNWAKGRRRFVNGTVLVDIVYFLESLLNEESRSILHSLEITMKTSFFEEWPEKMNNMLPALKCFAINGQVNDDEFSQLCIGFSNLRVLDISNTNIRNLSGMKMLVNLQILSMRNLDINRTSDLIELFSLAKLTVLDVSQDKQNSGTKIISTYLECRKILPDLKFIDCSRTDMNTEFAKTLLSSHPSIVHVSAIGCDLKNFSKCGTRIFYCTSIESLFRSLIDFTNLKNELATCRCLEELHRQLNASRSTENLHYSSLLKLVLQTMNMFTSRSTLINGLQCLIWIINHKTNQIGPDDMFFTLKKLLSLAYLLPETYSDAEVIRANRAYWDAIVKLTNSENTNFDEICWAAMNMISKLLDIVQGEFRTVGNSICSLKIVSSMTRVSKEACQHTLKFCFTQRLNMYKRKFNIEVYHIELLRVMRNVLLMTDNDEDLKQFTNDRGLKDFLNAFKSWDSERAYIVFSILAIFMNKTNSTSTQDELWNLINLSMMQSASNLLSVKPTENLSIYLENSILQRVLETSKDDGPIIWAFLTIKLIWESNDINRNEIRKLNLHAHLNCINNHTTIVKHFIDIVKHLLN